MESEKRKGVLHSIVTLLLLFIFQQAASAAGRFAANGFTYGAIDEHGVFAWISVHHIVQMLPALIVIVIISKTLNIDFGFNLGDRKAGMRFAAVFAAVILVYVLISYIAGYAAGTVGAYGYPLNFRNVAGSLGFQLLLSGPSEEILFRALPVALLAYSFGKSKGVKIWKINISLENIFAALFFSLAHISWTLSPFTINADWFQLVYAFILGLCYGAAYQKSKSVVYPMIMHSISNVFMVGAGYIFQTLFG